MSIFDRIFGSSDPIDSELDDVDDEKIEEQEGEEWPPYNTLYGERKWPYEIEQTGNERLAGRETKIFDSETDPWAGKYVRDLIESRRYKPKAPTRIGYTKDDVKGVQDVFVDHESLFKHMSLFGVTGYGKSTVMRNVMLQWANAGFGMCFIDPKGDDSVSMMSQIPPHRRDDIVWVEPGGNDDENVIGFNIFETQAEKGDLRYEQEVMSVTEDFVSVLRDVSNHWGPRMDNITNSIVTQLIRADEPYNLVDFTRILTDEEEMEAFVQNYGDELEQIFLRRVKELGEDEKDPVLRRLNKWISNRAIRQIMSKDESKINVSQAVQQGKILIINTSNIEQQDAKKIITRTVVSRVWSTIKTRGEIPEDERDPYYLCIDEFDKVVTQDFDINDIISLARSFRMSVFVANQQPSQLPDDVLEAVQQSGSMFSFNPGNNPSDQQKVSQAIGDVDPWQLGDLSPFRLVGRPMMDGKKQSGMYVHTFPEYPSLRSEDEAQAIINKSLEKFGTDPNISTDLDDYGVKRFVADKQDGYQVNADGETITQEQILECVYTAQVRNETEELGDHDDWISERDLLDEIEKYVAEVDAEYGSRLSNVYEQISDRDMQKTLKGNVSHFRLTPQGQKKAFTQDTGAMASGGKNPHRILLTKGHEAFVKLGYDVRLPTQQGGRQPDGVAEPPIKPMEGASDWKSAMDEQRNLVETYPRLAEQFGSSDVSIEAESTTISTPAQTIKNLIKAIETERECVFLVKDGSENKGEFEYWARAGENILTDPPFVRSVDDAGNRTFYKTNSKVHLANGGVGLVPADTTRAKWQEVGRTTDGDGQTLPDGSAGLQLVSSDSPEPIVKFDDLAALSNKPASQTFPFHYERDTQNGITLVKNSDGEIVDRYENLDELRQKGDYRPVYNPIIPDHELPDGEIPDDDMWTFVIIPDDPTRGPQLYENGDIEPLLTEDGGRVNPDRFDMPTDFDVTTVIEDEYIQDDSPSLDQSPFTPAESTNSGAEDDNQSLTELSVDRDDTLGPRTDADSDADADAETEIDSTTQPSEDSEDSKDSEESDDTQDDEESTSVTDIPSKHTFPDNPSDD